MSSSYFTDILNAAASRYAILRNQLLVDETDGDTVDDSHVCRILRAYYQEKGREFPAWLPPDPRTLVATNGGGGSATSSLGKFSFMSSIGNWGRSAVTKTPIKENMDVTEELALPMEKTGLSDLWDSATGVSGGQNNSLNSLQTTGSLNRRTYSSIRGGGTQTGSGDGRGGYGPTSYEHGDTGNIKTGLSTGRSGKSDATKTLNPSNSEKYQSVPSSTSTMGAGSAQQRLKARLYGTRPMNSPNVVNTSFNESGNTSYVSPNIKSISSSNLRDNTSKYTGRRNDYYNNGSENGGGKSRNMGSSNQYNVSLRSTTASSGAMNPSTHSVSPRSKYVGGLPSGPRSNRSGAPGGLPSRPVR